MPNIPNISANTDGCETGRFAARRTRRLPR
jgi:hypothetical protein